LWATLYTVNICGWTHDFVLNIKNSEIIWWAALNSFSKRF
jgi:hypothetical protein